MMGTRDEREEINAAIMREEDLRRLAYKAYDQARTDGKKLKEVLREKGYKPLTNYYSYATIVDDVLKYYIG